MSGSGLFFLVYVLIRVSLGNLQTLTAVRWQDSMSQNCVDFFRICGELQKKNYLALYVLRFLPLFISVHGLMHDVALTMQHELHVQQLVQTCLN